MTGINISPQIDRRHTPTQASRIIALAKHFHLLPEAGVVGLDLCGDPSVPVNLAALTPLFTEVRSSLPSLGLTVHFAEAQVSSSDSELDALLLDWRPDRLGHVICVSERVKGEIVQASRRKKGEERRAVDSVGLELCLSCNVHAEMVCGGFEGQYVFFCPFCSPPPFPSFLIVIFFRFLYAIIIQMQVFLVSPLTRS